MMCDLIDFALCPGLNLGFSHQRSYVLRNGEGSHQQIQPFSSPGGGQGIDNDSHQSMEEEKEQIVESMAAHVFNQDGKLIVTWILR